MVSAREKAGNNSLGYSKENPQPRTTFIFEDITHPATHGGFDECYRQQPLSDTVYEAPSVATTVTSPKDPKTSKCTLEDCNAPETCKNRIKVSACYSEARAQAGAADLSADLGHSSLPSNDREYVDGRKGRLSSGSFQKQAISTELIEITIRYLELMANYLSSDGSSEMKTAFQLTTHLLQHRYKDFNDYE